MSNSDRTTCSESRDGDCSACDIVVVARETDVKRDDKIEVDCNGSACEIVGMAGELNSDDDDDTDDESDKIEVLSSDWGGDCVKQVDNVDVGVIITSYDDSNIDNYYDVGIQFETCV